MKRLKSFLLYYLPPLLWMGLIFWLSSIPNLELQGELAPFDLVLRKLAHITEYAVLAVLILRALKTVPRFSLKQLVALTLAITFLYAISDEIHQSVVPTRDGKLADVLIDLVGIVLGVLAYYKIDHYGAEHFKQDCV